MHARLDVFSGRPNPTWRLRGPEVREVRERIAGTGLRATAFEAPRLGFRGVVIEEDSPGELVPSPVPQQVRLAALGPEPEMPPVVRAQATALAIDPLAYSKRARAAPDAEVYCARWLVERAADRIGDDLAQVVSEQLRAPSAGAFPLGAMASRASALALVEPPAAKPQAGLDEALTEAAAQEICRPFLAPMRLSFWNQPAIQPHNNCYNYATNFVSGTLAQPGRTSGRMYSEFSCENVLAAAQRDGLETACRGEVRVVALGIWPGFDFHWWRLHPGGFWAHKIGWWPAQNTDNSFRVLGNGLTPANCDRGPYTEFCGYYFAPLSMWVT